jgi:hypothetical protein
MLLMRELLSSRSSAFPLVRSNDHTALGDLEEEITRISPDPEEDLPLEFSERRKLVRRRANLVQGRSLEKLGHAVEYLVDSRMFVVEPETAKAERDAVQILMQLSRSVFLECEEVVTVWDKVVRFWTRPVKQRQGSAREAAGWPQL